MIVKTKGIVLKETPYSETSKILNLLTSDYGMIGVLSKGSRSVKSKLRGASQKFVYGEFCLSYKEQGLSTLTDASIIDPLKNIVTNIKSVMYVSYINELVYEVLKEVNDKEIFFLYKDALLKINMGFDPSIITNIMELKLLKYLGVLPIIDKCVNCGNNKNIITFDIKLGGMICNDCYHEGFIFDKKTVQLIRLLYYVDISKIDKLDINSEKIKKELDLLIHDYYSNYTGIYLKNKDEIKKIIV